MTNRFKQLQLESCHSTQEWTKVHLSELLANDPKGAEILVSTAAQTKGRGQGQNTWDWLEGALAFSFTLPPAPKLLLTSLEVAVLVAEIWRDLFGDTIELKWPNDLFSGGNKVGGLILHRYSDSQLIVGLGLNTTSVIPENWRWGHLCHDYGESYQHALPAKIVEDIHSRRILDSEEIRARWKQHCLHLDKEVNMIVGQTLTKGIFRGIGDQGEAVVEVNSQLERFFSAHLRVCALPYP